MEGVVYYIYVNGSLQGLDESSLLELTQQGILDYEDEIVAMNTGLETSSCTVRDILNATL